MSKQTAVEWLLDELDKYENGNSEWTSKSAIENHALRMGKEQIMKSFYDGMQTNFDPNMGRAELYYNEIYGEKNA